MQEFALLYEVNSWGLKTCIIKYNSVIRYDCSLFKIEDLMLNMNVSTKCFCSSC